MRSWRAPVLVLVLLAMLPLASLLPLLPVVALGAWLRSNADDPHGRRGRELLAQEHYAEALAELRQAPDDIFVRLDVAICLGHVGKDDEALAAFDRAIGDGAWWPPYGEKAHFLHRRRGLDAAVDWLEGLAAAQPAAHEFPYLLGSFLMEAGETARAVPAYERAVELAARAHGFHFDAEGRLLLDAATLAHENNDFADLWPTLEELAACQFALGRFDAAMRTATMTITVGQQLNRCKGYYQPAEVEAGSVPGRLIAARVYIQRGAFAAAEVELAQAAALARDGYYAPKVEAARNDLAVARAR